MILIIASLMIIGLMIVDLTVVVLAGMEEGTIAGCNQKPVQIERA
jgi:hypothetical protein